MEVTPDGLRTVSERGVSETTVLGLMARTTAATGTTGTTLVEAVLDDSVAVVAATPVNGDATAGRIAGGVAVRFATSAPEPTAASTAAVHVNVCCTRFAIGRYTAPPGSYS